MPAKKQSDGTWLVVRKDGTLGSRKFRTQKTALSAQRTARANRQGKKGAKKPKGKGGGSSGNPENNNKRPPGTGKVYQGARLTALAIALPTEAGILVAQGRRTFGEGITRVQEGGVLRGPHVAHQGINVIDLTIDRNKHVQQAASLTRMSVTAWLPEVLVAARTVEDIANGERDAWRLHRNYVSRVTGYDPGTKDFDLSRAREYRAAKHIGQAIRIAGSKNLPVIGRVARVLKKEILNPLGATL